MKAIKIKIFLFLILFSCDFINASFAATIILTSDKQLNELLDPDKKIDISTGREKRFASLREICEGAQIKKDSVLFIAFDEFFRQYRKQAGAERKLTPDQDAYIDKIKIISDFAAKYGMSIGLSLLSPLELGPGFKKQTGESGTWLHYKVGLRNPLTGNFSVQLWQQLFWTNNKGTFAIKLKTVKAYAFKEERLSNSPFKEVNPDEIKEITTGLRVDKWVKEPLTNGDSPGYPSQRIVVSGKEDTSLAGYDHVLVVLEYETPEMDYFSPKAQPFLTGLMKKYHDKGVNLTKLYSDEMHIQQDWHYFSHQDNGQFAMRFYSPYLADIFKRKYGIPFEEKYILYFVYGPPIDENTDRATLNVQYVFGKAPEDIQRTILFRDHYYKLLNDRVVDIFKAAKDYGDKLFGVEMETRGHASWAQSPTIDDWNNGDVPENSLKYEYTSDFVWSNTVQQAAAACYDYFKWGEYLQPTGNDFAEGGWNDRDYYGAAMAASIGVINKYPNAYAAAWGMPGEVKVRKRAINDAFGDMASKPIDLITGHVHRDVEALILYPMNLVAAEERFGSWMTQYGYANYITAEKLMQLGQLDSSGNIIVGEKKYNTLVTLFEPLPPAGLLEFMKKFANKGGKVVWFGQPPLIDAGGKICQTQWHELFGVKYTPKIYQGEIASGKEISFLNGFKNIPKQFILTDFLVDRIYPVELDDESGLLAQCDGKDVGAGKKTGKGNVYYFGFRPKDDQSASLGYETRTLFETLNAVGTYPASGVFKGINDNPQYISRTTDYLATRFPNGATVIVRHFRHYSEYWAGGFSRDEAADKKLLESNPLPSDRVDLINFKVNGNELTYHGGLTMAFRVNKSKELISFYGLACKALVINGKKIAFSETNLESIFFSTDYEQNVIILNLKNSRKLKGNQVVSVPLPPGFINKKLTLVDDSNQKVNFKIEKSMLIINLNSNISGKWLTLK